MLSFRKLYQLVLLLMGLLLVFSGCGEKSSTTAVETVPKQEEPVRTVAQPAATEALIVFLSGDSRIIDDSGERNADIGDSVVVGQRIVTGADGYVELQLGDLGAVRIDSNTEYSLDSVSLTNEESSASGSLLSGSVIAKVKKLSGNDSFEINVPGAVCAVRGTEFLVRADINGSVTVAVNEGSVYVAPPTLSSVEKKISGDDAEVIRSIMPLVGPAQELIFDEEIFVEVEAELAAWTEEETAQPVEMLSTRVVEVFEKPEILQIAVTNAEAIQEAAPSLLNVRLTEEVSSNLVSLTVRTDPQDADIYLNGRSAGRGAVSRIFQNGEDVNVRAVSPDGRIIDREVEAGDEALVEITFERIEDVQVEEDEPAEIDDATEVEDIEESAPAETAPEETIETVSMNITVSPRNAAVWIDGKRAGGVTLNIEGGDSDFRDIRVEAPGYETYERRIVLRSDNPNVNIELEPRLIVNRAQLPGRAVGTPASNRQTAVLATGDGNLIAFNRSGDPIWIAETQNTEAENTSPTIIGNRVYTVGNREFVIIDLNRGTVVGRRELSGGREDLFGRRIVGAGNRLLLPGDSVLETMDPKDGRVIAMAEIPQGSRSTPAVWNDFVIIADQRGSLTYFSSNDLEITKTVATEARQPIGQAPALVGNTALIAGRRGTVSTVDLAAGQVKWERPLVAGETIRVYSDIEATEDAAYVYGGGRVFALSMADGQDRFPAIGGVSAPPMVRGRYLFLCRNDGSLTIHNRQNGNMIGQIPLNETGLSRPVLLGDFILTAGERSAVIVDPRSIVDF